MMKKSGKILFLFGLLSSTYFAMHSCKKQKVKHNKTTTSQYKNRLEEFCLQDLSQAQDEFDSFINMGFNPSDAFELTIIRRVFV